jgi:hypothetical protein
MKDISDQNEITQLIIKEQVLSPNNGLGILKKNFDLKQNVKYSLMDKLSKALKKKL